MTSKIIKTEITQGSKGKTKKYDGHGNKMWISTQRLDNDGNALLDSYTITISKL